MPEKEKKAKTYLLKIDKRLCKGCRLCIDFCPKGVLGMSVKLNESGTPWADALHPDNCTGCKACALVCPDACIEISEQEHS